MRKQTVNDTEMRKYTNYLGGYGKTNIARVEKSFHLTFTMTGF